MHNTNIPCGCLIEYEGDQTHQDYSIDWCPLHKAAAELLDACQSVQKWLLDTGQLVDDGIAHPLFINANNIVAAAIAKATKE